MPILSFRSRELEQLLQALERTEPIPRLREIPPDLLRATARKLILIHTAVQIEDLRVPPGNRLELLRGDRAGQYSVRINDQWRICFRWQDGCAFDVELVDYH